MTDKQMIRVYRHDAHKMRGQSHSNAPNEMFGVEVNQDVAYGADGDAASMARPNGKPEQVLHGHETHYRRSINTGNTKYDPGSFSLQHYEDDLERLIGRTDAVQMHEAWLGSEVVGWFNESTYQPYTSLKYHTLLVGALVANYRDGNEFDDLGLWYCGGEYVGEVDITPFKTIMRQSGNAIVEPFELFIDVSDSDCATKLSSYPMRNFNSVWSRLPFHPWTDKHDRQTQVIDSQLRRIQSWSTGLQYLENALKEVDE